MCIKDEIHKAIGAHGSWKQKLRQAINTGQSESTPEKVKKDNNCAFGKWLYGRVDPSHKNSSHYKDVLALHAEFHREAGDILELALKGRKEEANEKIKLRSNFSQTSAALTVKMNQWLTTL